MSRHIRKIAFVLPNFQAGGAERVMLTVASNLDRNRFEPLIIVFNDAGPLKNIIAADVQVISLQSQRVGLGIFKFIKAMHKYRPAIAISTMAHLNMTVLLAKPFLPKSSIIVREAVTPSYFSDYPFKKMVLIAAYHILYPFADRILSPTKLVFEEMPAFLKLRSKKFRRVFNPVNINDKNPNKNLREALARPDQRLFVGAGRLVGQKGFDRLIEILKNWKNSDDWRLVILGDGPDLNKLQQMIDSAGLPQITLAGFEANPCRYFAVADVFLLPSRHEGLPNVALEALATGAPVIAMNSAGGIGEIAAEAGAGSVKVAQTMDEFLTLMNDVKPQIDANLRKSLLPACFTLDEVVSFYQQVFAELLSAET